MYSVKRNEETKTNYSPDWFVSERECRHQLQSYPIRYGLQTVKRYVNVLIDKWFKEILGAEQNKEALIGILRELIPERNIADINYGGKKKRKNNPFENCRDAVFDVECTDTQGARFVVEMQMNQQNHFHERALFYSSFPLQEQVMSKHKKDKPLTHDMYFDYPPVYVISFLNFSFHKESEQILYRYDLIERRTGELMTDRINFIFLEMPNSGDEEPLRGDSFAKKLSWAFTHMSTLHDRPASLMEEVFERFFAACEITTLRTDKQLEYVEDMTTKWDIHDQIESAWINGEQAGLEAGIAKGKAEALRLMARAMINQLGVSPEEVSRLSGLQPEEFME